MKRQNSNVIYVYYYGNSDSELATRAGLMRFRQPPRAPLSAEWGRWLEEPFCLLCATEAPRASDPDISPGIEVIRSPQLTWQRVAAEWEPEGGQLHYRDLAISTVTNAAHLSALSSVVIV